MTRRPGLAPAWSLGVLFALTLACDAGGGSSATSQAMGETIRLTLTAAAGQEIDPGEALQTAEAQATAFQAGAEATASAQALLNATAQAATATAVAPILLDLPRYGVDPTLGRPGWIHPPALLDIQGYKQFDFENQFITVLAQDMVVSSDITWNTTTGLSGCGFVLRSNGKLEDLDQYMVIASRGATGHVDLVTVAGGAVVNLQDIYAFGRDPAFDWHNDTTNRLTVVGRGSIFTIFSNGTRIDEIDASKPPVLPRLPVAPEKPANEQDSQAMAEYQQALNAYEDEVDRITKDYETRRRAYLSLSEPPILDLGFVALVAVSESGHTVCRFNNTWLWLMD